MPPRLTCPQGHQWDMADNGHADHAQALAGPGRPRCPVCGAEALPLLTPVPPALCPTVGLSPEEIVSFGQPTQVAGGDPTMTPRLDRLAVPGYEILDVLGRGGMGVVYKARQLKLNRVVALKMILAQEHASPGELTRFRNEAEAIAQLQHPHIVQIYDVGEERGLPFLALEFCPGGTLADRLQDKPLPPLEAAELVETLARAIQAAHERNIIHRDLKPANVLFGQDGQPRISDFGLAKRLDSAGPTATGTVMGTAQYMAPEQADNRRHPVGPAADVYALGAVLYEALTGRPPFTAATLFETVLQVLNDPPVPPRQLQPRLPRALETICLKCLHKDPGRRYACAADLAEDLHRFGAGEPVKARPSGYLEQTWLWARRNPVAATLIAAVALLVQIILVGFVLFALQQGIALDQTRQDAERAVREAEALRQDLFDAYLGQARAELRGRSPGSRGRCLEALHLAENIPDLTLSAGQQHDLDNARRAAQALPGD